MKRTHQERSESTEQAARTVLVGCLGVRSGEDLLVITDPVSSMREVADVLVGCARRLGTEAVLAEMGERESDGAEPPAAIAAAMLSCDVVVAPTATSLSHTTARKNASDRGVRIATMPTITTDIMVRTMAADYAAIARRSAAIAALLSAGSEVRITSENGTNLTVGIEGRRAISDDGDLGSPGAFGNLPAGEAYLAPLEGTANGRIVFDGSVTPLPGVPLTPIDVEVRDGFGEEFSGSEGAKWRAIMAPHGREAFNVAELGIGTNDRAKLTGNVLEDEKVMGTVHIAFGDNHTFGGEIEVASHLDGVLRSPTLDIDGRRILDDGRLII
jgi:leucyl aminopeptidase (aminopeptidase T)